ncbi:MAG: hypothetical protein M3N98_00920 [Actinomycetota bacterium]|nr:hypothetical protein [Actinomycetota bacterium]
MTDRIDLSDVSLPLAARPQTPEAIGLEMGVEMVGGNLWTAGDDLDLVSELPNMCQALRQQTGVADGRCRSVAVVDWTSLHHARQLIEPSADLLDPFTALADLGAVIAAVLFYDRVLVIPEAADANALLGVEDVVRAIPTELPGLHDLLDSHYRWALDELDRAAASDPPAPWLSSAAEAWGILLPGVEVPTHTLSEGYERLAYYRASPERRSYLSVTFQQDPGQWVLSQRLPEAILDNDLRAVFYERLSTTLQSVLSDGDFHPEVRYVGGCLRSPMLMARAKAAEAALLPGASPENWIQESWRGIYQARGRTVQAPFWLQAVLAASHDRQDIPEVLGQLRQAGSSFRSHRAEFAEAIAIGDQPALTKLMEALAGDLDSLTKSTRNLAGAAGDVATAVLKVAAPVVPTELINAGIRAAGTQTGWLKKLGLRLFKPQLWFVLDLAGKADRGTEVVDHAARLFHFAGTDAGGPVDAGRPVDFLDRLGQTTWIA